MTASRAAIAAGHPISAQAGAEVLRAGGTAIDAAIAAILTAFSTEPVMSSPGGGGFAAVMADGQASYLDFFTAAPGTKKPLSDIEFTEIFADFGTTQQGFHIGAGSSATPGLLPGLFALHERFGRMPFATLAEPAIAAAGEGVVLTEFQQTLFSIVSPILLFTEQGQALFGQENEAARTIKPPGSRLIYPELADCLDAIAREGLKLATHGEVAAAMAAEADRFGGHLSLTDIQGYTPQWRKPLEVSLSHAGVGQAQKATFISNPLPAQGGAFMLALLKAMLEGSTRSDAMAWAKAMHRVDQAWRSSGGRADPLLKSLGLETDAAASGHRIVQRGTSHVSAIDADGQAIAITVSNGEGNGRIVPGCGFMLNNMLGEEDVNPEGFHQWTPGARLSSMMAPTLAVQSDGSLLAIGSGGSNRIRTAMAQVIGRSLMQDSDADMSLNQAVSAPRIHVERGHLDYEDVSDADHPISFSEVYGDALATCLDSCTVWPGRSMYFGGVNAVALNANGETQAAGDPRRDGSAIII